MLEYLLSLRRSAAVNSPTAGGAISDTPEPLVPVGVEIEMRNLDLRETRQHVRAALDVPSAPAGPRVLDGARRNWEVKPEGRSAVGEAKRSANSSVEPIQD